MINLNKKLSSKSSRLTPIGLAAKGNVGLYVCKGLWISGVNPTFVKEKKKPEK